MNKFYLWLALKCLGRVKPKLSKTELIDTSLNALSAARGIVNLMYKNDAPHAKVYLEQDAHHLKSKQWAKYTDHDGWVYLESHGCTILDKEKGILGISVNY